MVKGLKPHRQLIGGKMKEVPDEVTRSQIEKWAIDIRPTWETTGISLADYLGLPEDITEHELRVISRYSEKVEKKIAKSGNKGVTSRLK